ncbi:MULTISPECIES: enoyl-CoA hydratase/isomerase family protein [unclassified Nocardioides]|uniref:enoyl-CoA hydratase/isomerase family protein n=1 Tax=unclassified Nocardioides TaxID=2615069 RepID=UPI00138F43AA|nr:MULTISPECIES: enoyl-CoA hydratase/isomerase family protein [unclassified Nocardioides]
MIRDSGVVTVVMNWAGHRGVLGPELAVELAGLLLEIAAETDAKAVVITGVGDVFAAGRDDLLEVELLIDVVRRHPLPMVAAVQRACIGAGLALALACDLRFVAADAILCPTPGAGKRGAARDLLVEEVGTDAAQRLLGLGAVEPRALVEWGVNARIVPTSDVLGFAQEAASAAPERPASPSRGALASRRRGSLRSVWPVPATPSMRGGAR